MKIYEAAELLKQKKITPAELIKTVTKNDDFNSFITVCDSITFEKSNSPLWGIPVAIKDNICTKGVLTTAGSKMLANFIPPYDSTVVGKLKACGAVIIGKTNMDEFGMGSESRTGYFGEVLNPINPSYTPGGSSGGNCAAVKSGMALGALGSDTGGSIRQPASFCGLYGMKPTYSLVSRFGLVAFASSLDCIGPICQSAKDCAIILDAIAGYDEKDATSANRQKEQYTKALSANVNKLKIGIPREFLENACEDVKKNILKAAENYKNMGAEVEECSVKSLKYAVSSYYIISSAEAASNLARFDGVRFGLRSENYTSLNDMYKRTRSENFGDEVKRRILLGTFVLSEGYYDNYYAKAKQAQQILKDEFNQIFEKYDALLTPVTPINVWKRGEKNKIEELYKSDICTASVSLAGLPAISVPSGKDENNMPVGFQLIGRWFSEQTLLNMAWAYEEGGFADGI